MDSVAELAERAVRGPREAAYGNARHSFQRIADLWSAIFGVEVSVDQVAAAMIALKISRELGGKGSRDNLVDIVGYALLWDDIIQSRGPDA